MNWLDLYENIENETPHSYNIKLDHNSSLCCTGCQNENSTNINFIQVVNDGKKMKSLKQFPRILCVVEPHKHKLLNQKNGDQE